MKYLIAFALFLTTGVFVYANDAFRLLSACRAENAYVLELSITDGLGLELNPSHSPQQEIFGSGTARIPLGNDWVELRAMYTNPAPIQMLFFADVPDCADSVGESEEPKVTTEMIREAVLEIQDRFGE